MKEKGEKISGLLIQSLVVIYSEAQRMPGMLLLDSLTVRVLPCPALCIPLDKAKSSQDTTQYLEFLVRPVTCRVYYKEEMEGTALFPVL